VQKSLFSLRDAITNWYSSSYISVLVVINRPYSGSRQAVELSVLVTAIGAGVGVASKMLFQYPVGGLNAYRLHSVRPNWEIFCLL